MKKKLLSVLLSSAMIASVLAGCGSNGGGSTTTPAADNTATEAPAADNSAAAPAADNSAAEAPAADVASGDKLYVYSWNTELGERLELALGLAGRDDLWNRIEYVNVGDSGIYQERIDQLLQAPDAEDYPDIIAFEAAYIMKYTNSDYTLPITDLGITTADLSEMYPYTLDIPTDKRNGSIKGLSWQACPGSFMYRTDLAESLLGVKSPEEMQAKISTWDDFIATAHEIKEKSGDATRMLSSNGDIAEVFRSNMENPWVDDSGVFRMDPIMEEYMDLAKTLEQEDLTQKTSTWSDEWNAGPSNDSVFAYFGCTWFLHWTIKANCGGEKVGEGTYGLWNMCQGPMSFYWGGTWLGATAGCSDPAAAGEIMKILCCDTTVLTEVSRQTLDYVNNKTAMKTLSDEGAGAYDFLGGQDFIAVFSPLADQVDVSFMSAYDQTIGNLLDTQLQQYSQGQKDKETAIADFKAAVAEAYPTLTIE